MKKFDVCIIGGAGHIGLPLGLLISSKKKRAPTKKVKKEKHGEKEKEKEKEKENF